MLFNSLNFLVFYIVVFAIFWFIRRSTSYRILFLLGSSLFFYMSWNWKYLGLIAFTTMLNYYTGIGIDRSNSLRIKKLCLIASLVGSLSVLCIFKYYNFFLNNLVEALSVIGVSAKIHTLEVLLPVGISFYTFQCLSYTIDIYRKEIKPTQNFRIFFLYISFFPQLVAGPIVRAKDFLPQLVKPVTYDDQRTLSGLWLIFVGLFKKIVIADVLATTFVDKVFASPELYSGPEILIAIYGYAMQIYCDFSGYSDIAIGIARTLGYDLKLNFNSPYLARDIRDFWRRWHISLSTWLRDYLYISLGGSRGGGNKTSRNVMITMLLGGLWHGAAWNFVIWGAYHGILVVITGWIKKTFGDSSTKQKSLLNNFVQIFITFNLVCFGWVMFRSPDVETFMAVMRNLIIWTDLQIEVGWFFMIAFILGFVTHFTPREIKSLIERKYLEIPAVYQGCAYSIALIIFTAFSTQAVPFIYFQF